jgi:hypothetical protein
MPAKIGLQALQAFIRGELPKKLSKDLPYLTICQR